MPMATRRALSAARTPPSATGPARQMLTLRQICDRLQAHRTSVLRLVERGILPEPFKLTPSRSGKLRFDAAEVEAAIAAMRTSREAI
jgi:predicted DNA-binding transcriptional regulator AlpA